MKQTAKELYEKLPSSWSELTVEKFIKLAAIDPETEKDENFFAITDDTFTGVDNTLKVLSILLDVTKEDIEDLKLDEVMVLASKIKFMDTPPLEDKKNDLKYKTVEEFTYGDFILFNQFSEKFFDNLQIVLPAFMKEKITAEEALQINVEEMYGCFFLQRMALKKLLHSMISSEKKKLMKFKIQQKFSRIFKPNYKVQQEQKQQQ